jgi:hypothetical protein
LVAADFPGPAERRSCRRAQRGLVHIEPCLHGCWVFPRLQPAFLFAERWDGTSWFAESMPEPVGATYPFVSGLSCTSNNFCIAVGSYLGAGPDQPFAERWDGSAWSVEPMPQVAGPVDTELSSVSCTSSSACIAVGQYSTFPFQGTYKDSRRAMGWDQLVGSEHPQRFR